MSQAAARALGGFQVQGAVAAAEGDAVGADDRALSTELKSPEEAEEDRLLRFATYGCQLLCNQVDDGTGVSSCTVS